MLTGRGHDAARYAELQGEMHKLLKVYEAQLAEHKFLCSDNISAADLFHLPLIRALKEVSQHVARR